MRGVGAEVEVGVEVERVRVYRQALEGAGVGAGVEEAAGAALHLRLHWVSICLLVWGFRLPIARRLWLSLLLIPSMEV